MNFHRCDTTSDTSSAVFLGKIRPQKPQIDVSNYICRAAQLLSKLYATFSRATPGQACVLRD